MHFKVNVKKALYTLLVLPVCLVVSLEGGTRQLPQNAKEVKTYLQRAKTDAQGIIDQLLSEEHSFSDAMHLWDKLSGELILDFGTFIYLSQARPALKFPVFLSAKNFQGFVSTSLCQNPQVASSFIALANKYLNEEITPYENYELYCRLEGILKVKDALHQSAQDNIHALLSKSSSFKKTPYIYLRGEGIEKRSDEKFPHEGITILNLNTCFLPGHLPTFLGGLTPWEERLIPLAEKILIADPDVVCLQEVFSKDAAFAWFEQLKRSYSHFYIAIGPRVLGFSVDTLGLPSGLFLASKYPIAEPTFTLFPETAFPANYGFFDFYILDGSIPLAHIYTTHLQAMDTPAFVQVRISQIKEILEKMERDYMATTKKMVPVILCGDLNISWGANEAGEAMIRENFFDAYNHDRKHIDANEATYTDFTKGEFSSIKQMILDYALLFRSRLALSDPLQKYEIKTHLLFTHQVDQPESALSDHHGMLSILKKRD